MVRFGRHPPRWSAQRLKRLALALVLAHIGTLIIVALYYLVFEVHYHVAGHSYTLKHWWDTTVSNADLRHSIRNVAEALWTSQWNQKIIAFAVAFICCRPLFPVFDGIQLWFAERRAYRQQPPRWWQADTYQARVNDVAASGITKRSHGWLFNGLMSVSVIGGLVLASYGWYVLTYIAKG
jgi:hypothetical protein